MKPESRNWLKPSQKQHQIKHSNKLEQSNNSTSWPTSDNKISINNSVTRPDYNKNKHLEITFNSTWYNDKGIRIFKKNPHQEPLQLFQSTDNARGIRRLLNRTRNDKASISRLIKHFYKNTGTSQRNLNRGIDSNHLTNNKDQASQQFRATQLFYQLTNQ